MPQSAIAGQRKTGCNQVAPDETLFNGLIQKEKCSSAAQYLRTRGGVFLRHWMVVGAASFGQDDRSGQKPGEQDSPGKTETTNRITG